MEDDLSGIKRWFEEKDSTMGMRITIKDGEGRVTSKFEANSNYTATPIAEVTDGHLWSISRHPQHLKSLVYVPSDADKDVFTRSCKECVVEGETGVALWCSLTSNMFRGTMGRKINDWASSPAYQLFSTTKVLGLDRSSQTWVFSQKVQIDINGALIPPDRHQLYFLPGKERRETASVALPLSTEPLKRALVQLQGIAKHNFLPCVYGLGAQIMMTNAPLVCDIFDACAPICLVGPSGRGKTLTMKVAQALVGMQNTGLMKSAKREAVIAAANKSTLGLWIDDPLTIPGELVVDFYNLSRQETLSRGTEEIRCGLMFTSNNILKGYTERENRRILYIKYGGPPITPANPAERTLQVQLKQVILKELSAAAGMVVRLGEVFKREGYEDIISTWEPFIKDSTNGLCGDLALQYAILHWFARQLMTEVGLDAAVLDSYWLDTMAGHVSSIQPESTEVVQDIRSTSDQFKLDIVEAVTSLSDDQVKALFQLGSYSANGEAKSCVCVYKDFFNGKMYIPKIVNSLLKTSGEGLGKCQSRTVNGVSTQAVLVNLTAFTNEQQLKLKTALNKRRTNLNSHGNIPADVPNNIPDDVPANNTADVPANITADVPANNTADAANIPANNTANAANIPANNTVDPANNTADPANNTADPANNTADPANIPANNTADPANIPANNTADPANNTADPANIPANNTADPANIPANNTADPANIPANNTADPANNTADPANIPANNTADPANIPANNTADPANIPANNTADPSNNPDDQEDFTHALGLHSKRKYKKRKATSKPRVLRKRAKLNTEVSQEPPTSPHTEVTRL